MILGISNYRNDFIENGFVTKSDLLQISISNILEKGGKRAIEGEIREFKNGKFKKENGKWVYINKDKHHSIINDIEQRERPKNSHYDKIHELEKSILIKTGQKFESCFGVKDANEIYNKDGDKTQISLSDKIHLLNGSTFTHNHPSSRCFSKMDLITTITHGISEMRAIAPNSIKGSIVWCFKNNSGSWSHNQIVHFHEIYDRFNQDIRNEFQKEIDSAMGNPNVSSDQVDKLCKEKEATHHYELMRRLAMLEKSKMWEFYYEKF